MSVKAETVPQQQALTQETTVKADQGKVRHKTRGRVRVFRNWCKGCGLCIAFCPRQVFTQGEEHRPVVTYPERCVACQWCTMHCPDFAVVVDVVENGFCEAAK